MNNILFWLGFFSGITTAVIIMLYCAMKAKGGNSKMWHHQERSEALLAARNDIDRGIAKSLEVIARYVAPKPTNLEGTQICEICDSRMLEEQMICANSEENIYLCPKCTVAHNHTNASRH